MQRLIFSTKSIQTLVVKTSIRKNWFMVRNIHDYRTLADLAKISHTILANKSWFTV